MNLDENHPEEPPLSSQSKCLNFLFVDYGSSKSFNF